MYVSSTYSTRYSWGSVLLVSGQFSSFFDSSVHDLARVHVVVSCNYLRRAHMSSGLSQFRLYGDAMTG